MFKNIFLLAILGVLSFGVSAEKRLTFENRIVGEGQVYEAVDGDTVWLNVERQSDFNKFVEVAKDKDKEYERQKQRALRPQYRSIKIRIANINTAESVHADAKRNTKEGKIASDYLKTLANGRDAKFACWDHDKYGRLICSVEVMEVDGTYVDIGYRMITEGHSDYVTRFGKHPYAHNEYAEAAM